MIITDVMNFQDQISNWFEIGGEKFIFDIDGDQCCTWAEFRGETVECCLRTFLESDEYPGLLVECLDHEGGSWGYYYHLNILIESWDDYMKAMHVIGPSLIAKFLPGRKLEYSNARDVVAVHKEYCPEGELTEAPAIFGYHCSKCGCRAFGQELHTSKFFDKRRGDRP